MTPYTVHSITGRESNFPARAGPGIGAVLKGAKKAPFNSSGKPGGGPGGFAARVDRPPYYLPDFFSKWLNSMEKEARPWEMERRAVMKPNIFSMGAWALT